MSLASPQASMAITIGVEGVGELMYMGIRRSSAFLYPSIKLARRGSFK